MGTEPLKINSSDMKGVFKVILWVAASGAATAILQWLPSVDFGGYQTLAMGIINIIGVLAVKYGLDTRK